MASKTRMLSAAAGLAIAAAAYAQPALFTDLGDHSTANNTGTTPVTLISAADIQWFKIKLPTTTASLGFVDLWTNGPGNITDSEMGIYDNLGAKKAEDDDDGPSNLSALSFGKTSPTRVATPVVAPATSLGLAYNGRDGNLTNGIYWIAVGRFNVTFNATAWSVTSTSTSTERTMTLGWNIEVPPASLPLQISTSSLSSTSGQAGATFNAFATISPGTGPASTGITVSLDASGVAAGTLTLLDNGVAPDVTAGDNIFSGAVTVGGGALGGTQTLTFNASDAQARTATATQTYRVLARPSTFTDLGDLSSTSNSGTTAVTLVSATDIQWFKAKLPVVSSVNGYVDVWTNGPGNMTDSLMGVYDDSGVRIASDDDDGPSLLSALSFGQTTPTRAGTAAVAPATAAGLAYDGRDGALAGGTYWIAVGRFSVTFNATGWDVSSTSTSTDRTTTLGWNIVIPGTPTNPTGVAVHTPASGLAGSTFVSRVTVTPGTFPASTGINVNADASSVGGGSVTLKDDGVAPDLVANDNIFSGNISVSGGTVPAAYSINYTVSDSQLRSSANSATFTVVPPPPANDNCANASVATLGTTPFTNVNATVDGSACAGSGADVWFSFQPPANGNYSFATCGTTFDTVLSLHPSCGAASIGCNDDNFTVCSSSASYFEVNGLLASNTYLVRVASFSSSTTGTGTLTIANVTPPPPTNPTGIGSATPATSIAGTTALLKVTVTPGANPATTNHTVTVDLSSLVGGSPGTTFYDDGTNGDVTPGDNVFSRSYPIDSSQASGTYAAPFTIGDTEGRPGSGTFNINVIAAAQWDEITNGRADAGNSVATAQAPFGTGSLSSIDGHFAANEDVDIYRIQICDFANFSASADNAVTNNGDTQLFLFGFDGTGVQMDDDTPISTGLSSQMGNQFVTANGDYYLAVSHYDVDPLNAGGFPIWEDSPFNVVRAPDGTTNGGDIVLSSWSGTYATAFNYRLVLTGTCFPCVGDFNRDGTIDFFDYLDFVDAFTQNQAKADINLDGSIDFFDYLDFVDRFTSGC